jgi:hypothetical protein
MVLQRRVQMPEPDLQAIAKNVVSVSALAKEATTGCMNAMGWMAPREDPVVSMHDGAEEVVRLLTLELSARGLTPINDIAADSGSAPRNFFRGAFVAALLAWCDQTTGAGVLHISASTQADAAELKLHFAPTGDAAPTPAATAQRPIDWEDVQALARSNGVTFSRGEGWLRFQLALSPV